MSEPTMTAIDALEDFLYEELSLPRFREAQSHLAALRAQPPQAPARGEAPGPNDRERELEILLRYAVTCTTKGPVAWLVPAQHGDNWSQWVAKSREVLGAPPQPPETKP